MIRIISRRYGCLGDKPEPGDVTVYFDASDSVLISGDRSITVPYGTSYGDLGNYGTIPVFQNASSGEMTDTYVIGSTVVDDDYVFLSDTWLLASYTVLDFGVITGNGEVMTSQAWVEKYGYGGTDSLYTIKTRTTDWKQYLALDNAADGNNRILFFYIKKGTARYLYVATTYKGMSSNNADIAPSSAGTLPWSGIPTARLYYDDSQWVYDYYDPADYQDGKTITYDVISQSRTNGVYKPALFSPVETMSFQSDTFDFPAGSFYIPSAYETFLLVDHWAEARAAIHLPLKTYFDSIVDGVDVFDSDGYGRYSVSTYAIPLSQTLDVGAGTTSNGFMQTMFDYADVFDTVACVVSGMGWSSQYVWPIGVVRSSVVDGVVQPTTLSAGYRWVQPFLHQVFLMCCKLE